MNDIPFPPSFQHRLRIRGVDVALQVFPTNGQFMFHTNKLISENEKKYFAYYMQQEGFLDNPITGESADNVTL